MIPGFAAMLAASFSFYARFGMVSCPSRRFVPSTILDLSVRPSIFQVGESSRRFPTLGFLQQPTSLFQER